MQQGGRGGSNSQNGRRRSNSSNVGNGHKCGGPQMGAWAAPGERPAHGMAGEPGASQPAPGEYYGSMAAGSIVGAASRCARQGTYMASQPGEPARVQTPRNHGRRARHASSEGKGSAVSCRAQLVHRHEGWLLSAEGALSAPTTAEGVAQLEVKPARCWFCLTTNAISAYIGPSKITNMGALALRAVRSFGWISQAGEHHIVLRVLRSLPAATPPPPRGEPAGSVDEKAAYWEVRLSLPPKEEPLVWYRALSTVLPCTTSPPLGSPRDMSGAGSAPTGIGAMRRPATVAPEKPAPATTQVVQVPVLVPLPVPVPVPVPVPMIQTHVIPVPMAIPPQHTTAALPPPCTVHPPGSSVASPLLGSAASQSALRASQPHASCLMCMPCMCSRLLLSRRHGDCCSRLGTDRLRRSVVVCWRAGGRDQRSRFNWCTGRGRSPGSGSTARNSPAGSWRIDTRRCHAARSRHTGGRRKCGRHCSCGRACCRQGDHRGRRRRLAMPGPGRPNTPHCV